MIMIFLSFQVPIGYDLIQVIDLYFKIHFVFNLNFEPNLAPMLNFFKYFVYELRNDNFTPPTKMLDIWNRLKPN